MTISPQDAAKQNDLALKDFLSSAEAKIDAALIKEYYTGGPPVDIDPVIHPTRKGVDRLIMERYNKLGWEISVAQRGDKSIWQFVPAKK